MKSDPAPPLLPLAAVVLIKLYDRCRDQRGGEGDHKSLNHKQFALPFLYLYKKAVVRN